MKKSKPMTLKERALWRRGWQSALRKVWREFGGKGRPLDWPSFMDWASYVQPPRARED